MATVRVMNGLSIGRRGSRCQASGHRYQQPSVAGYWTGPPQARCVAGTLAEALAVITVRTGDVAGASVATLVTGLFGAVTVDDNAPVR